MAKPGRCWALRAAERPPCSTCWPGCAFRIPGRSASMEQPLLRPRPHTGLILQDYGLLPWATVRQNAELGLRVRTFYGPDGKHAPQDFQPEIDLDPWLERLGLAPFQRQVPRADFRRAAPAHRHRPHPGAQARPAADGRAVFLAGRADPQGLQNLTLELWAEQKPDPGDRHPRHRRGRRPGAEDPAAGHAAQHASRR